MYCIFVYNRNTILWRTQDFFNVGEGAKQNKSEFDICYFIPYIVITYYNIQWP